MNNKLVQIYKGAEKLNIVGLRQLLQEHYIKVSYYKENMYRWQSPDGLVEIDIFIIVEELKVKIELVERSSLGESFNIEDHLTLSIREGNSYNIKLINSVVEAMLIKYMED